jgi:outer membrane cobalamin receptor
LQFDRTRIVPFSANTRGLEVSLSGVSETFNWAVSYSLSRATERLAQINRRLSWDQRHAFKAQLAWHPGHWLINVNAEYHDGHPITELSVATDDSFSVGPANASRLESYARLDIKFSRPFAQRWQFWFELSNALNLDSVCCIEYRLDDSGSLVHSEENWLPLVPTLGLEWRFN